MVAGSSPERTPRVSNIGIVSPAGDCPLIVYGLYLSKLVRRSGFCKNSIPPLGASGFT